MFKRACLYVVLGTALALPSSCFFYKDDPNYCPGEPHDNCLNKTVPVMCDSDEDCTDDMKVCDLPGTGFCVQCTPENKDACQKEAPECISNMCQRCTTHDQCNSKVCLIDQAGTCADANDVAYVQGGGSGSACTLDMPCGTLAPAVATGKRYIKMAVGMVKDNATTTIQGRTVAILADPGAILDRDGDGTIIEVRDANTNVTISDLRITGATGVNNAAVQLVPGGSGMTSLSLTRVTVDQNQGAGVSSAGGALSISRSTFSGNQRGAISVDANEATFDITNNFIVRNGDGTPLFGGVYLKVVAAGSSRFEFNTVVDNRSAMGAGRSGGIICLLVGFIAPNNIIARNQLGTSTTDPNAQSFGDCIYRTSKIQSDVAELNFVSPDMMPYSYKLLESSSAIDQATTASTVTVDHDGDPRPQGAQKDIGADELRR
jgi:hypothetical protein